MSIASITFLRDIANHLSVPGEEPVNVQLVENGYLFLAQKKTEDVMRENFQLQRYGYMHASVQPMISLCISVTVSILIFIY